MSNFCTKIMYLSVGITILLGVGCERKVEAVQRFQFHLESVPKKAKVFNLRGREMGKTPFLTELKAGDYALKLELENYEPQWFLFAITPGKKHHHRITLDPITASILVDSNPEGVQVSLKDRPIGITPVVVSGLSVGTHSLTLTKTGYAPQTTHIEIKDARPRQVIVLLTSNIGRIVLNSNPPGAHVFIDDREHGITPYQAELPEGQYRVRISKSGYSEVNDVISVVREKSVKKNFILVELPGKVTITTEPDKVDVYIDDKPYGQTPLSVELPAGNHMIRVTRQGFDSDTREITIVAAAESKTHFTLTRNTGGIDLLVNPPGTMIYVNGKIFGVTEQDGDNKNLSKVMQLRQLNAGTYKITAAHRHAVPDKKTIEVIVPKGAIARPNRINLWVANAELKLNSGSVKIGMIYSENADEVVFGPEPGVKIKYSRSEIEYLKPLMRENN